MKKVLIINQGFSNNFGDQAIGVTMEELVTSLGHEAVCVGLASSNRERKPLPNMKYRRGKKRDRLKKLKTLRWVLQNRKLTRAAGDLSKYDMVLIGGGELVQDNSVFPYAINQWVSEIKKAKPSMKIYLFGVGVTAKYEPSVCALLKKALKEISGVYVRDGVSAENMKNIFGLTAVEIPDVVFASQSIKPVAQDKENCALLGITSFFRVSYYQYSAKEESYYSEMCDRYCRLKQEYGQTVCIYSDAMDRSACLDFAAWCKENRSLDVEVADYRMLDEMVDAIRRADYLESPRMHACIMATLCNTRFAPIEISPKMRVYREKYIDSKANVAVLRESVYSALRKVVKEINEKS